jgi:hypothetical protein
MYLLIKPSLKFFPLLLVLCCFSHTCTFASPYSSGPRATGEVILQELVQGQRAFIIRVGSNGGTSKSSFSVSVKKAEGPSERSPLYLLTIVRTRLDENKAIVDDGAVITYDLQKDFGITGNYIYSVTNPVASPHPFQQPDESFISTLSKQLSLPVAP